jgi:hypothetical protein
MLLFNTQIEKFRQNRRITVTDEHCAIEGDVRVKSKMPCTSHPFEADCGDKPEAGFIIACSRITTAFCGSVGGTIKAGSARMTRFF